MKWFVIALLVCCVARAEAQEQVDRTFSVSPTVSLRIWLPSGRVSITMRWG